MDPVRQELFPQLRNPECECGGLVKRLTVKKQSKNQGRMFYTCEGCGAFRWVLHDDTQDLQMLNMKHTPIQPTSMREGDERIKRLEQEMRSIQHNLTVLHQDLCTFYEKNEESQERLEDIQNGISALIENLNK